MASRKEQKEQLRKERQEREAVAQAAARRRRLIGYGAGGALVAVVAVLLVVLLAGGGGDGGGGDGGAGALPSGGEAPAQKITDLDEAAKAAGCELKDFKGSGTGEHTEDASEVIKYSSNPPSEGRHFVSPTEDGAYAEAPDVKELVHALEHGRIIIWFKKTLPEDQRADLKALFDEDSYQLILTPNETQMTHAVAATAWNREPAPGGTGRLLGCPRYTPQAFDAIRAFKDEHRSNGPEAGP